MFLIIACATPMISSYSFFNVLFYNYTPVWGLCYDFFLHFFVKWRVRCFWLHILFWSLMTWVLKNLICGISIERRFKIVIFLSLAKLIRLHPKTRATFYLFFVGKTLKAYYKIPLFFWKSLKNPERHQGSRENLGMGTIWLIIQNYSKSFL